MENNVGFKLENKGQKNIHTCLCGIEKADINVMAISVDPSACMRIVFRRVRKSLILI